MIRAGRALMYSKGYLPTTKRSHKTIIEFTKLLLGHEYYVLMENRKISATIIYKPIYINIHCVKGFTNVYITYAIFFN